MEALYKGEIFTKLFTKADTQRGQLNCKYGGAIQLQIFAARRVN
jgi:hypothetical protein